MTTQPLKITVFTTNRCVRCDYIKRALTRQNIQYETINCQEDTEPREEFDQKTPAEYVIENFVREMPVVLVEYLENGEIQEEKSWWFSGARQEKVDQISRELALLDPSEQECA